MALSNAAEIAADLAALAEAVPSEAAKIVAEHGAKLLAAAKQGASGRPGPNVITGTLRRSIGLQVTHSRDEATASVGTNAAQARRLEFGFYGMDSLGRRYNQPPYPFLGPALDRIQSGFEKAMEELGIGKISA